MEKNTVFYKPTDKVILPRIREPKFNHPNLSAIMTHLQNEFKDYKYTVYRCAAKCVALQKAFFASNIPYKLVLAVLERHGINNFEHNFMVPPFQLTALIHDIYFACEKLGHFSNIKNFELETATAVLANFFWNIFDPRRYHSISLIEIKVTFILLCKLYSSEQLVAEFYNVVCDQKSEIVTKFNFEYFLSILVKYFTYIGEGKAYGEHNMRTITSQCFAKCNDGVLGLNEYQFYNLWSSNQTRFIIYGNLIALIKRIEDTEKLIHNNGCASCHKDKIIGIRFKCQICNNLSLCMKCFATGYSTNKHQPGHRIYEVFTEDLPPKKFTHYFSKLCNLFFTTTNCEETKNFCNDSIANETELVSITTSNRTPKTGATTAVSAVAAVSTSATADYNIRNEQKLTRDNNNTENINAKKLDNFNGNFTGQLTGLKTTASNALNASERLQLIIERLLIQNRKLELQLKCLQTTSSEEISIFLSGHQTFLIEIINEMRNLTLSTNVSSYPTASTPNRSISSKENTNLESFYQMGANLSRSINGADINRSYLDANKSDYSLRDLSMWFNRRTSLNPQKKPHLATLSEVTISSVQQQEHRLSEDVSICLRDTEMINFKLLLKKVKEIVEDSYSDNTELATATQNLEHIVDNIIQKEEHRRRST